MLLSAWSWAGPRKLQGIRAWALSSGTYGRGTSRLKQSSGSGLCKREVPRGDIQRMLTACEHHKPRCPLSSLLEAHLQRKEWVLPQVPCRNQAHHSGAFLLRLPRRLVTVAKTRFMELYSS